MKNSDRSTRSIRNIQESRPLYQQRLLSAASMVMFAALLAGLGLIDLYFGTGQYQLSLMNWILQQPLLGLLNLLPFLLIGVFLWALTGHTWTAFGLTGILCLAHAWPAYWKLMARSEPVTASDLGLLREAADIGGNYITFTRPMLLSVLLIAAGLLFLLLEERLAGAGTRRKGTGIRSRDQHRGLRLWVRAAAAFGAAAAGAALLLTVYFSPAVYDRFETWDQLNGLLKSSAFLSRGSMYPFLNSFRSAEEDTQDIPDAETLLSEYTDADIPEDRRVSVICVMLEAFSDLSEYTDAITGTDPYAELHALEAESYHGRLVTNIFGGGTIDTEHSFMTGFSELPDFSTPCWSYARYFLQQGYAVNYSHPGTGDFYDRRTVNANLGFPCSLFREDAYDTGTQWYMEDEQFLMKVSDLCEESINAGTPVFSMNVTYQNHGPYSTDYQAFSDVYVPQGDMDHDSYMILNNYLDGVHRTSVQLAALAECYRYTDRPVILVFFGDHKPWLGDQSEQYQVLGIDLTSSGDESFYNYYCTDYIIWANNAAKQALGQDFVGEGPDISPCFLMNELFRLAGWQGSAWTQISDAVMEELPVVTSNGVMQENGALVTEENLSDHGKELLEAMRSVQSYLSEHTDETPGASEE